MTYAVKEIIYTLQGEGVNAGRPAVFLRFAGCNLWSGRNEDRLDGPGTCSQWCDTDFVGLDGPGGGRFETDIALAAAVRAAWTGEPQLRRLVVCTGGEPLLQLDEALVRALHDENFEVAVETNGTMLPPPGVDWVCVSPKAGARLVLRVGDELKLVYPQADLSPQDLESLDFRHFLLQPMDGPSKTHNIAKAVDYCLHHPTWRLSVQLHKELGIP